jgi:hypothetical protein
MGLGMTLQEAVGWQGQYMRMCRWHERIKILANDTKPSKDELDFLLAFFDSAFHLRDWLKVSGGFTKQSLDKLFQSHVELKITRDIANAFKHFELSKPSQDGRFSIVNEYVPVDALGNFRYPNGKWTICAGGEKIGLVELTERVVEIWNQFLKNQN